ncbi:MAG: hypothetical protein H6585_10655 [Flavobacteriales bacterium]|nr:hypothetical protein [Flavobacteriales bacterium]MCB9448792.1 hypothetical protein [Flavobacteriales bacterium]
MNKKATLYARGGQFPTVMAYFELSLEEQEIVMEKDELLMDELIDFLEHNQVECPERPLINAVAFAKAHNTFPLQTVAEQVVVLN